MIDLDTLANVVALLGCAFLLVFWLVVSRRLAGFFYVVAGWVTIVVAARSDHQPAHLAGILIAAVVIVGLLVASKTILRARWLAARRHVVYVPLEQRRARLAGRRPR